jgi:hypothetical protein
MMDRSQMLSQQVERDVRQLIGDLQMQIIVLRTMLDQSQQPTDPKPHPAPPPQPQPEQNPPEQQPPGKPPQEPEPSRSRSNGAAR